MTTPIDATAPIGGIAAARPDLIPLFDRFGLDYCCHGHESLGRACTRVGASLAAVLDEARRMAPARTGARAVMADGHPMGTLCDEIEREHHAFVREAFLRLEHVLPRVVEAHAGAHPELTSLRGVVERLRAEMMDHMVREERVLFPWLRRLEQPQAVHVGPPWSVKRPIDCMVHDHDAVAEALARIRTLTQNYTVPPDACESYTSLINTLRDLERDTRVHIHKENNILFPAGIEAEAKRSAHAPTGAQA